MERKNILFWCKVPCNDGLIMVCISCKYLIFQWRIPFLWKGHKLSSIPTELDIIECFPHSAKLSRKSCAMRYARYQVAKNDKRRVKNSKQGYDHCIKCETGKENLELVRKAKSYRRRITDATVVTMIKAALRYGHDSSHLENMLGYKVPDLKAHLENQFKDGMNWDNSGEWHIDHILPRSCFEYKTVDDPGFKQCWAISNLQPLWAKDNIKKGRSIQAPL